MWSNAEVKNMTHINQNPGLYDIICVLNDGEWFWDIAFLYTL